LLNPFLCSTAPQAFLRPDRGTHSRRAQTPSRLPEAPEGLGLDGGEHGGKLEASGQMEE
jgi:hypothetical protein